MTPAKLAALRRVDAPKPDPVPMDFQGIAVDDTGLAGQIVGREGVRGDQHQGADNCPPSRGSVLCNPVDDAHGQKGWCDWLVPGLKS